MNSIRSRVMPFNSEVDTMVIIRRCRFLLAAFLVVFPGWFDDLRAQTPSAEPSWKQITEAFEQIDAGKLPLAPINEIEDAVGAGVALKHRLGNQVADNRNNFLNGIFRKFKNSIPDTRFTGNEYGKYWTNGEFLSRDQKAEFIKSLGREKLLDAEMQLKSLTADQLPLQSVRGFLCAVSSEGKLNPDYLQLVFESYVLHRQKDISLSGWPTVTPQEETLLKLIDLEEFRDLANLAFQRQELVQYRRPILRLWLARAYQASDSELVKLRAILAESAAILTQSADASKYCGDVLDLLSQDERFWNDEDFLAPWNNGVFFEISKKCVQTIASSRTFLKELILGEVVAKDSDLIRIVPSKTPADCLESIRATLTTCYPIVESEDIVHKANSFKKLKDTAFDEITRDESKEASVSEPDSNVTFIRDTTDNKLRLAVERLTIKQEVAGMDIETYGTWTQNLVDTIRLLALARGLERVADRHYVGAGFVFDEEGREKLRESIQNIGHKSLIDIKSAMQLSELHDSHGNQLESMTSAAKLYRLANDNYNSLHDVNLLSADKKGLSPEIVSHFEPRLTNGQQSDTSAKKNIGDIAQTSIVLTPAIAGQVKNLKFIRDESMIFSGMPAVSTVTQLGMLRTHSQITRLQAGLDAFSQGAIGAASHFGDNSEDSYLGRLTKLQQELEETVTDSARRVDADTSVNAAIYSLQRADHHVSASAEHLAASKFDLQQAQQTVELKSLVINESEINTKALTWGLEASRAISKARDEEQQASFLDYYDAELELDAAEFAVAQIINSLPSYVVQFEFANELVPRAKESVEAQLKYADEARRKWKDEHEKPLLNIIKSVAVIVVDCVCTAFALPPIGTIAESVISGIESAVNGDWNGFAKNLSKAAKIAGVDKAIEGFAGSIAADLNLDKSPFIESAKNAIESGVKEYRKVENKIKDLESRLKSEAKDLVDNGENELKELKKDLQIKKDELQSKFDSIALNTSQQLEVLVSGSALRRFGINENLGKLIPLELAQAKRVLDANQKMLTQKLGQLKREVITDEVQRQIQGIEDSLKAIDETIKWNPAGDLPVPSGLKDFVAGRSAIAHSFVQSNVAKLQIDQTVVLVKDTKNIQKFLREKLRLANNERELELLSSKIKRQFETNLSNHLAKNLHIAFTSLPSFSKSVLSKLKEGKDREAIQHLMDQWKSKEEGLSGSLQQSSETLNGNQNQLKTGAERLSDDLLVDLRNAIVQSALEPDNIIQVLKSNSNEQAERFASSFQNGLLALKVSFDTSFSNAVEEILPSVEAAKAVNVAIALQEEFVNRDDIVATTEEQFKSLQDSIQQTIGKQNREILKSLGDPPQATLPDDVVTQMKKADKGLSDAITRLRNLINSYNFKEGIDNAVSKDDQTYASFRSSLKEHFDRELQDANKDLLTAKDAIGVDAFVLAAGGDNNQAKNQIKSYVSNAVASTLDVINNSVKGDEAAARQAEKSSQESQKIADVELRNALKIPVYESGLEPIAFRKMLIERAKSIQSNIVDSDSMVGKLNKNLVDGHHKGITKKRMSLLSQAAGHELLAAGYLSGQREVEKQASEIRQLQARIDKGIAETLVKACESRVKAKEFELKAAESEYQRCRVDVARARLEQWLTDQIAGANESRTERYESIQKRIWQTARDASFVARIYLKLKEPTVPHSEYWTPAELNKFIEDLRRVRDDARYQRLASYDFNVGAAVIINEQVLRNVGTQLPSESGQPGVWSIRVDLVSKRGAVVLNTPYENKLSIWFAGQDFPDWRLPENEAGILDSPFSRVAYAIKAMPKRESDAVPNWLFQYADRKMTNDNLAISLNRWIRDAEPDPKEGSKAEVTSVAAAKKEGSSNPIEATSTRAGKIRELLELLKIDNVVASNSGRPSLVIQVDEGQQVSRSVFSQTLAIVKLGQNQHREPIYFRHLGNGWLTSPIAGNQQRFKVEPVRWSPAPLFQLGDPLPWILTGSIPAQGANNFERVKQLVQQNGVVQAAHGGLADSGFRFSEKEYLKPPSDSKNFSRFYPLLGTYELQIDASMLGNGGELIVFFLGLGMQESTTLRPASNIPAAQNR